MKETERRLELNKKGGLKGNKDKSKRRQNMRQKIRKETVRKE
jgi:hypothetical protein